jgi:tetratricopeptide (TPR) repeat protein
MSFSVDRHIRRTEERYQAGQYDAALLSARKWVAQEPENPMARYWQGLCLERLGQPDEAELVLREGLSLDPGHTECLSMLARCEAAQGKQRDAYETARRAEQLGSDKAKVWESIGIVYGWINEFQDAARMFEKVREMQPDNVGNLSNLASMLNYCHRVDESDAIYRQALQLDPTRFLLYWSLSQLSKQTPDNNHVSMLQQKLAEYAEYADAQLYLNLALAKELEDLERYAESFSHLTAGMRERRKRIDYRTEDDRQLFDTIRRTFSPAFCQAPGPHEGNAEPIFILGMPRTGSTLLEQMVAADPEVFAAGELHNFFASWVGQLKPSLPNMTTIDAIAAGGRLDFARLGREYIQSTRPRTGHTTRFIDKLPDNFLYVGAILKALPNARVIHMTRNPVDTCYAVYKQLFARMAHPYSYDQKELALYYCLYRDLMTHWKQCFPGAIFEVSYDSLIQDTENQMQRVFDFLGLEWRSEYLEYRKKKQAVGTASTAQVRQPVYRSSLEKWRHYEQQLQPLLQILVDRKIVKPGP